MDKNNKEFKHHKALVIFSVISAIGIGWSINTNFYTDVAKNKTEPIIAKKRIEPFGPTADTKKEVEKHAEEPAKVAEAPSSTQKKKNSSYVKNDFSVSSQIAIEAYRKDDWYISIVSIVEGFRSKPYRDNIGQAVAFGYNYTFQSKANNTLWTTKAGLPDQMVKEIVALSGRAKEQNLPTPSSVVVSPEQAISIGNSMRPAFEKGMIALIGETSWNKLDENKKATLVYHSEKVGLGGASKYKGLIKAVREYASNPTLENAEKASLHIDYSYKLTVNGETKTMHDERSAKYMRALFVDPKAYGFLLGADKAPANFAQLSAKTALRIDPAKPAIEQIQAQDEFGKLKEDSFSNGTPINIVPTLDGNPLNYEVEVKIVNRKFFM